MIGFSASHLISILNSSLILGNDEVLNLHTFQCINMQMNNDLFFLCESWQLWTATIPGGLYSTARDMSNQENVFISLECSPCKCQFHQWIFPAIVLVYFREANSRIFSHLNHTKIIIQISKLHNKSILFGFVFKTICLFMTCE